MAVVGLEQTFLRVSENIGVVELCAIVRSPVITCPIAFPFDVSLFTYDGTAGQLITEARKGHPLQFTIVFISILGA